MQNPNELAERYVALWNEPDIERRRATVRALWADDGMQILQPPRDIRERAAAIGFFAPTLEACGHEALVARVGTAYEEFVAPGKFEFRGRGEVVRLKDVVKFEWEMVPVTGGEPVGGGTEFVVFDGDGRIRADYQFIDP